VAHLDGPLILPVWPVYVDASRRTCREFAGALVNGDCFELEFLVDVDGLQDVVWSVEDDERVTGNVNLYEKRVSLHMRPVVSGRTIVWRPSHRP
jgi:hypothetical protein